MAAKDFQKACPLLAESYRLDPLGGTLQNLAVCYEALGLWASAYGRFQQLRSLSKRAVPPRADRIALADEHIAVVEPRLSRVKLVLAPQTGNATVSVKIDDIEYGSASWSAGILLDPGTHALVVVAVEKMPYRTTISVTKEGATDIVQIPRLEDAIGVAAQRAEVDRYRPDANLRAPGLLVGGVGGAALAVGVVFGVLTIATNNAAKDRCSGTPGAEGFDAAGHCVRGGDPWRESNAKRDDARTFANVSNVLVPVGVVGLGVCVYLVLRSGRELDRPPSRPRARLVPSFGGAAIEGTF